MKKICCCVLMLLLGISLFAQRRAATRYETEKTSPADNEQTDWVGFCAGPSFPVGALANTDLTSNAAGFASTGLHLNLNLGYHIRGPVGIYMMLHTNVNRINADAFGNALSQSLPAGVSGSFEAKPWQMSGLLTGLYFRLPSHGASSFYLRALIGYASVSTPGTTVTLSRPGYQTVTATIESKSFSSFGYGLGAGANVKLNKSVVFLLNFDFLSATPTVNNLKTTYSNGAPAFSSGAYDQPYSVMNITAGLAFSVHK